LAGPAYTQQEFQYLDDVMKDWYAKAIVNQVYKKSPIAALVKKKFVSIYGKSVQIPVRVSLTEAVGARQANVYALPTAQKVGYDRASITMQRNYGRIQLDGFGWESSKGKGGWVDAMTGETRGVADAFAIDLNRQCMGRGDGVLGHVASLSTPAITVDNPFGISSSTTDYMVFRAGMVLDAYDLTDNGKDMDSNQIASISGNVLTMNDSVTGILDGDFITREDSCTMSGAVINTSGEIMGIDGIVGTDNPVGSAFEGIDATSVTIWTSTVATSQGILTEGKIQGILDSIEQTTDGEAVNLAITTYALRNKLIEIVKSDRLVSGLDLTAGWRAIKYMGGNIDLNFVIHKHVPTGYIYFLSLPHLKFYTLKKLVWDRSGGGVIKPVAGYDAYESWFKMYANLATDCRNAHGKGTGFTT
jgi:hypothetical protein